MLFEIFCCCQVKFNRFYLFPSKIIFWKLTLVKHVCNSETPNCVKKKRLKISRFHCMWLLFRKFCSNTPAQSLCCYCRTPKARTNLNQTHYKFGYFTKFNFHNAVDYFALQEEANTFKECKAFVARLEDFKSCLQLCPVFFTSMYVFEHRHIKAQVSMCVCVFTCHVCLCIGCGVRVAMYRDERDFLFLFPMYFV